MSVAERSDLLRSRARFRQQIYPRLRQRLVIALVLSLAIIAGGTLGYVVIEGWSLMDGLYMTLISITTVGFTEVHPLDTSGRILTSMLIVGGVAVFGYTLTVLASTVVESEVTGRAQERRMRNAIESMRNHVILCGYGRVGVSVASELNAAGVPFVVIDQNLERIENCIASGYLVFNGDATDDTVLSGAGIERAHALISALDDDAQNVYITLSARVLNPDLIIAARAASTQSERKLELAGAQHVISPYVIAGHRLAGVVVRPRVIDFLDTVIYSGGLEFWLEEIVVGLRSPLVDETIAGSRVRRRTGALVLALVHADGTRTANPSAETIMHSGDTLIAIGTREQLDGLQDLASSVRPEPVQE